MREIKFRGKRKDTWEWVYGYFWMMNDENNINKPCITVSIPGSDSFQNYEVYPETVGQFSNKLDAELHDVYEGDIVQGGNGKMWEVIYSLKASGWIISNKRIKDTGRNKFAGDEEYSFDEYRRLCKSAKTDTFKKIGNIHDNPELVNPPQGQAALNTMNNLDPKEPTSEQAQGQEATQEQAAEQTEQATMEGETGDQVSAE